MTTKQYPSAVCPGCGRLVENVPPDMKADIRDFCPHCSKFAPVIANIESTGVKKIKFVDTSDDNVLKPVKIFSCKLRCPDCDQKIEIDVSLLGEPVRCPQCGQKLKAML